MTGQPTTTEDPKVTTPAAGSETTTKPNTTTTTTSTAKDIDEEGIAKLPAEAQAEIRKLRAESQDRREKLAQEKKNREVAERERDELKASAKQKEEEAERQKMEEEGRWKDLAEKNAKKVKETEQKYQERTLQAELKVAAQAAGIISPVVAGLIPKDKITFNDAGDPVGVAEAVEAFKAANPTLFGAVTAETTVTSTGSSKQDPNPGAQSGGASKAVLEMSNEEYAKAKAEKLR